MQGWSKGKGGASRKPGAERNLNLNTPRREALRGVA